MNYFCLHINKFKFIKITILLILSQIVKKIDDLKHQSKQSLNPDALSKVNTMNQ